MKTAHPQLIRLSYILLQKMRKININETTRCGNSIYAAWDSSVDLLQASASASGIAAANDPYESGIFPDVLHYHEVCVLRGASVLPGDLDNPRILGHCNDDDEDDDSSSVDNGNVVLADVLQVLGDGS